MQPTRTKAVVWDPQPGSSRFVVGGGSELRMFDWEHARAGEDRFTHIASTSELSQVRTFAWSPDPSLHDLMAVGLTTGRTLLLRLDPSASLPAVSINVRSSRPVNTVAFAERTGLLAIGLEKARGESLLVYDISSSASTFEGARGRDSTPSTSRRDLLRNGSPTTAPASAEPHPLVQLGSSETVTSAAFLASNASVGDPLLVAGMGGKWLRAYDLRSPGTAAMTWSTRSVFSISPNPFNGQQFASHGDEGVVKLYDLRKPGDALLSFSEVDAGAVSSRVRPIVVARPLAEMAWSPARRGLFATLEKDSQALRVWNIADGPAAQIVGANEEDRANFNQRREPSTPEQQIRLPVVLGDQRPPTFDLALTSFAFAHSPSDPGATYFVGVARDANAGTSGHRTQIVELRSPRHSGFTSDHLVVPSDSDLTGFRTFSLRSPGPNPSAQAADQTEGVTPEAALDGDSVDRWERGRPLSMTSVRTVPEDPKLARGSQTPRPSGSVTPRRLSRMRSAEAQITPEVGGLAALGKDQSNVLRDRLEAGYGHVQATTSAKLLDSSLVDSSIAEFWKWVARAEILARDACLIDYDFRFRGIIPILHSFPPASATSSSSPRAPTSPLLGKTTTAPTRTAYSDSITRSLRIGDEAGRKNAAYASAAQSLWDKRKTAGTFGFVASTSSALAAQRNLALQNCGQEWEEDCEVVCQRFARLGDYEAAARHAFFSGRLESAMNFLRSCGNELRLLAPVLAAYVAQKDSAKGSDGVYSDLCRSLSLDGEKPWIRAMFAYLASGDWRELLDESGLALRDRCAIALRFLADSELLPFLQDLGKEAMASGDLEAVVLYGLRDNGLDLISNFIDRTADVQTAAIAASFVYPGLIRDDRRVARWIESYRSILDSMELYAARAMFDAAQGQRSRVAMEQARQAGRLTEANAVGMALKRAAPPQLLIRCLYCATNIAPSVLGKGDRGAVKAGVKATMCPTCQKTLPSCAVCLTKPSVHSFASDGSSSLAWCQTCRHGGHVTHILDWFLENDVCPVTGCNCNCRAD